MKKSILIFLLGLSLFHLSAEDGKTIEFNNKPINDILLVLANLSGKTLIPDSTIKGYGSYYFAEDQIDEALDIFLEKYKLYSEKKGNVYHISKVFVEYKDGNITVKAEDVNLREIIKKITMKAKTVVYDSLPNENLTINIENVPVKKAVEILIRRFNDYELIEDKEDDYFYIKRKPPQNSGSSGSGFQQRGTKIEVNDKGLYSVNVSKVRFKELLKSFFDKAGVEYSNLGRNDNVIDEMVFKDKTFDEMLELIMDQGNCDYSVAGDIYYIFDVQRNEILNKYVSTVVKRLEHITVRDFMRIIPGRYISGNVIKTDDNLNTIILNGTPAKITPIINFAGMVDVDTGVRPHKFSLNFIKFNQIQNILLNDMGLKPITVDNSSFIVMVNEAQKVQVEDLIKRVDIKDEAYPITLNYIKSEDLLKSLPKSIDKESISQTNNPSLIFFHGSEQKRENFLEELELLDKPIPQIQYKLLVIQYQKGDDMNWKSDSSSSLMNSSTNNNNFVTGALGNLLNLNFNIVSTFGQLFAVTLNMNLTDNHSRILADTTINGLSGESLSFRNTSTIRYQDKIVDPDSGNDSNVSGATREVASGLIIDLEGHVTGNNIITMNVNATVSQNTTSADSDSTTLPSTTEKMVKTNVRTREGEPVIIGGLIQREKSLSVKKTPIIGDIPLLGYLFKHEVESETEVEFVIYIIPFIDEGYKEDSSLKFEQAYKRFSLK